MGDVVGDVTGPTGMLLGGGTVPAGAVNGGAELVGGSHADVGGTAGGWVAWVPSGGTDDGGNPFGAAPERGRGRDDRDVRRKDSARSRRDGHTPDRAADEAGDGNSQDNRAPHAPNILRAAGLGDLGGLRLIIRTGRRNRVFPSWKPPRTAIEANRGWRRGRLLAPAGGDEGGEVIGGVVGDGVLACLDHHPNQRLGAARPQQHPAGA